MTTFEEFAKQAQDIKPERELLSTDLQNVLDEDIKEGREFDAIRVERGLPSQLNPEEVEEESKS